MKTIFDKATRDALIVRINNINEHSTAQWGKMNVYQMLKHCTLWEEWILGRKQYKRSFIGRFIGRLALRAFIKDDRPLQRNTPTIPEFSIRYIKKDGDVAAEKAKLIALLQEHEHVSNPGFVHSFFGKMSEEEVGYLAYKHFDHHLRQFNC